MKRLLKLIPVILIWLMLGVQANAAGPVKVFVDGGELKFDAVPVLTNGTLMVPMRSIFEAHGALIYWNAEQQSVTSKCGDVEIYLKIGDNKMLVNGKTVELERAPYSVSNRTYVPIRAISEAFGSTVVWDQGTYTVSISTPVEYNTMLKDIVISDELRYNRFCGKFNTVNIFDNGSQYFGMELVAIRPWQGEEFADIVNGMASDLPGVRVFCGVIPTAAEFYAATPFKTNYLSAIAHIYNNLNEDIIPLNLEGTLNVNSGQYIYFRTDHHWTHFGAYCAYLDFCERAGLTAPSIDSFEAVALENYLGSWGKVSRSTIGYYYMSKTKDRIVIYQPNVGYTGKSYYDMEMKKFIKDMQVVNSRYGTYDIFLEGDYPIDHFHTNITNGKSICVIKDSYGNAFSTWLINNYEDIYVVDYRSFNSYGTREPFTIKEFYELHPFDDLLVLSYPYTIAADDLRQRVGEMWRYNYKNPEHITDYVPNNAK